MKLDALYRSYTEGAFNYLILSGISRSLDYNFVINGLLMMFRVHRLIGAILAGGWVIECFLFWGQLSDLLLWYQVPTITA